jgi:hypothetical protein
MFNAPRKATATGWKLYRTSEPPLSLEEINVALAEHGLMGISKRTYDHYHRLVRHGFEEYLPINELDMHVKHKRQAG